MVWYLLAIPIVIAIVIKLVIPYIKKKYVDDDRISCPLCYGLYKKSLGKCPRCQI